MNPGATDPGATDSGATDSGATDPGATDPGATDPGKNQTGTNHTGSGTKPVVPDFGADAANLGDQQSDAVVLAAMAGEVREANERALRAQAELENFRKRMRRDSDEQVRYATLPLIRDLLPVVDNLERACQAAATSPTNSGSSSGLLDGVKMVVTQLISILQQNNCQRIEAIGVEFDPHLHEAIAQEPSQEIEAGRVTRVTQMGYRLHDRVIRPSLVLVSTGTPTKS